VETISAHAAPLRGQVAAARAACLVRALPASAANAAGESLLTGQSLLGAQEAFGSFPERRVDHRIGRGGTRARLGLGGEQLPIEAPGLPLRVAPAARAMPCRDIRAAIARARSAGARVARCPPAAGVAALRGEPSLRCRQRLTSALEIALRLGGSQILV